MILHWWMHVGGLHRRAWVLVGALASLAVPARAQQVLVQANVADDTVKTVLGPNRRYYGHILLGYALAVGAGEPGAALRYGLVSGELRGGGRLKRRLSQALALNLEAGYAYLRYDLAQNAQKTLPSSVLHRSETLELHQLYSEMSLRLNAGRRGNSVGSYLDLLVGGSWLAATAHGTDDEPGPGIGSVHTTEHGLPYLRPWLGVAGARLGFDRYALSARYQFTGLFLPTAGLPELPRWRVGFEIGLF